MDSADFGGNFGFIGSTLFNFFDRFYFIQFDPNFGWFADFWFSFKFLINSTNLNFSIYLTNFEWFFKKNFSECLIELARCRPIFFLVISGTIFPKWFSPKFGKLFHFVHFVCDGLIRYLFIVKFGSWFIDFSGWIASGFWWISKIGNWTSKMKSLQLVLMPFFMANIWHWINSNRIIWLHFWSSLMQFWFIINFTE